MKKLRSHFTLEELISSNTATRLGIDNTPSLAATTNLVVLCSVLEMLHAKLNSKLFLKYVAIFINSGFRCEALERVITEKDYTAWLLRHKLKRSEDSWQKYFKLKGHPDGRCADIVAPTFGTPAEIAALIISDREIMRNIDQLILEGTWLHIGIAVAGVKPRNEFLVATFINGTPQYERRVYA